MSLRRIIGISFLEVLLLLLMTASIQAQSTDSSGPVIQPREQKEPIPTRAELAKMYDSNPGNSDAYHNYLSALMTEMDYDAAKDLVTKQQRYNNSPDLHIDLGSVLEAAGSQKKAKEEFDAAVASVNGDEVRAQQLAGAFSALGKDEYAIQIYERCRNILRNPYVFSTQLARLYAKKGDINNAIDALLSGNPSPYGGPDETKATLLELLGNDPGNLQLAQKSLLRRINLQPDNTYFAELLTWLYTQKGDWEGALIQVEAIDERTRGAGLGLLQFAQQAEKEGQHAIANKSLDAIMERGKEQAYYSLALSQKLGIAQQKLETDPNFSHEEVQAQIHAYDSFFNNYPQYGASEMVRDYARVEAQFNNNPKKGIQLLQHAIQQAMASREFIGRAKLQMGDYQILDGKIWEASLTYSQVDKDFKQDVLGEEARFRNAKLAYYRGDFKWAQTQLSVLKASTSELIANDALYLSVLITENTPDSNNAALLMFSRADLLLFQNKNELAQKELDSITSIYPKHPLQDDVLMLRSNLAQKNHDYEKALGYLQTIYTTYGKDVLGDDAVFKTAEIYERALKKPDEAKKYYEKLILDYPGSTYIQTARVRLQALSAGTPQT